MTAERLAYLQARVSGVLVGGPPPTAAELDEYERHLRQELRPMFALLERETGTRGPA